ncbi:unnamed protein product [Moneuplotes crassus]|uniref:Uncharacterized protein n=1 Tax=Euplotes crassus TaxID=5936 RepID=A0AAD1Y0T8_EUPCR|nr:unnamed protein product [Moneuplotes crassus]
MNIVYRLSTIKVIAFWLALIIKSICFIVFKCTHYVIASQISVIDAKFSQCFLSDQSC